MKHKQESKLCFCIKPTFIYLIIVEFCSEYSNDMSNFEFYKHRITIQFNLYEKNFATKFKSVSIICLIMNVIQVIIVAIVFNFDDTNSATSCTGGSAGEIRNLLLY